MPASKTPQQGPSAHVYWESLIAEAKRPRAQNWCCLYRPRRGVSHTQIGYAWVMLTTSFACLTSDWLTCLSSDWLILKTSSWQKTLLHMYTLGVYPNLCVVARSSQHHPAMAHVASHRVGVALMEEVCHGGGFRFQKPMVGPVFHFCM